MKILFLSRWFPDPPDNGSKIRVLNLLRGLSQYHDVTLLSFSDQPEGSREAGEVRSICSEVDVVPWREFDPQSLRSRLGYLSMKPRSLVDTFSREMAQKISRLLSGKKYDLVIASQLPMAAYHPYFQGVTAVFEELELGLSLGDSVRAADWHTRIRHAFGWIKLRHYLARLLDSFCAVTVVSEREKDHVREIFPRFKETLVIPNCINVDEYKDVHAEPKPRTMIFSGSFRYRVNYEAMVWFIGEVFPLILEEIPDAEMILTGDHLDLPLPFQKNIHRTGYVNDIREWIAASTIAVIPLWSGGGTRFKILEAMAIGTPVVATSKGAEGLEARNGEHLLIGDLPKEFAAHVVTLLRDGALRDRMAMNAREFVKEKYDWSKVMPEFLRLVAHAGAA